MLRDLRGNKRATLGNATAVDRELRTITDALNVNDTSGGHKRKKVRTYLAMRAIGERVALIGIAAEGTVKMASMYAPELSGPLHIGELWQMSTYLMDSGIALSFLANYLQAKNYNMRKQLKRFHDVRIATIGTIYDVFVKPPIRVWNWMKSRVQRSNNAVEAAMQEQANAHILDNLW